MQKLLDKYLIGSNHVLAPSPKYIPDVVSNEMKKLVDTNQQIINTFDEDIKKLGFQKDSTRSVKEMLLGRFQELINKVWILEFVQHSFLSILVIFFF